MKNKTIMMLSMALSSVLFLSAFTGCAPKRDKSKINDFEISYYSRSDYIESIDWVGQVTGEESISKTFSRFNVGGTDLGIPLYNSKNDTVYVFFGDTFMAHSQMSGDWRSNVCLTSKDYNLSDGLYFDGAVMDEKQENRARAIIDGLHSDSHEMTKIPTGGIEINGNMYMFYFSKNTWTGENKYSMNYGGCVKSADNGKTWERVYDLSWADHGDITGLGRNGLAASKLQDLINLDVNNRFPEGEVNVYDHVGFYFTQIAPVDGRDGYIYILGEGGYRTEGIKLGRVLKENFEKFEEYEYYIGTDGNGDPIWEKGIEGLQACDASDSAFIIGSKSIRCGEHSVMYNEFLDQWLVTYLASSGIVMRMAQNIWGPYSQEIPILGYSDVANICPVGYQLTSIYGGFMNSEWVEGNGQVVYMTFSQYSPFYNSSLLRVQFYEDMKA